MCQDRAPHEISIGCSSSCITPPPNQISDSTLQCVTVVLQFSTSAHQGIATSEATHPASSWTASISGNRINSQSLEVRYILQKYSWDKYTSERAFKPSYTFLTFRPSYTVLSISAFIYTFQHLSLHIHFPAFKPSYTFSKLFDLSDHYIFEHLSLHINFIAFKPSYTF